MKRIAFIAALLVSLSLLASCNQGTRFTVALAQPPESNVYTLGEDFRTEGLTLLVTFENGATEEVAVTPSMVTFSSAHAGAAVAVIAYTYDGYTAYTYVTTVIRDTLSDLRAAALLTINTSEVYLAHATDPAVKSLYATAAAAIATATTADEVTAAKDTFLAAAESVTSDKTDARNRIAAVSLDGLSGEYLVIAQNERARALVSVDLARTKEEAERYAALYAAQVENLIAAQASDISAAEKRDLYIAVEEYFRRTVESNSVLYAEEDLSALRAAYSAATLGILSSDTRAEAEAFRDALLLSVSEAKTLVDTVYDALLSVYAEGEVVYTAACRDAITALRAAMTEATDTLPTAKQEALRAYAVSADRRIEALTYTDGRIDLPAALIAAEALYATLTEAGTEAAALTVTIGEIGTVTLASESALLAAENAFLLWTTTYTVSERNAALLLGTAHADLTAKRAAFDTLREGALALAATVKSAALPLRAEPYLSGTGEESAITAAENAYAGWIATYGASEAAAYLADSEDVITAARAAYTARVENDAFNAARLAAAQTLETVGSEAKALKPDKLAAISAILSEAHGAIDEVTLSAWKEDSSVFTAIIAAAEDEMNAL